MTDSRIVVLAEELRERLVDLYEAETHENKRQLSYHILVDVLKEFGIDPVEATLQKK